ncbi:MAG: hypothetical protein GY715_16570 [Planctomycetes bacterium]|nr:hypothetical protein [Planctomycetota bacterium]
MPPELPDDLTSAVARVLSVLRREIERDEEFRRALRGLGEMLVELAADTDEPRAAAPVLEPVVEPKTKTKTKTPVVETTLEIGDAVHTMFVPDSGTAAPPPALPRERGAQPASPALPPVDMRSIVKRCGLKARSCRWAIDRRGRVAANADCNQAIAPTDKELMDIARDLPNCYVWMLDPYGPQADDDELAVIAECYDNLAQAAETAEHFIENDERDEPPDEDLVQIIATIQSALRRVLEVAIDREDLDQREMFRWLRDLTQEHGIPIRQHMRLNDPADPASWDQYRDDLFGWIEQRESRELRQRKRQQLVSRIRYHVKRLIDGPDVASPHDWERILETTADWTDAGFPASNKDLCAELARLEALEFPDDLDMPPAAEQVFDAVDRYIALRQRSSAPAAPRPQIVSDEVRRAADLLRGRVAVLIGGDERVHARNALERELELQELRWIPTRAGMPLDRIESEMIRGDVAVVILAIRWSSHVYKSFAEICQRHGIPFVRLLAGYSPNQVAHHVLKQAERAIAGR